MSIAFFVGVKDPPNMFRAGSSRRCLFSCHKFFPYWIAFNDVGLSIFELEHGKNPFNILRSSILFQLLWLLIIIINYLPFFFLHQILFHLFFNNYYLYFRFNWLPLEVNINISVLIFNKFSLVDGTLTPAVEQYRIWKKSIFIRLHRYTNINTHTFILIPIYCLLSRKKIYIHRKLKRVVCWDKISPTSLFLSSTLG